MWTLSKLFEVFRTFRLVDLRANWNWPSITFHESMHWTYTTCESSYCQMHSQQVAAELPLWSGKFIEAHLSARSMKPTRTLREDVLPWSEYRVI